MGRRARIAPLHAAQTGNHLAHGCCAYSCGRPALRALARPRIHDKPSMLLRRRAVLAVSRATRLLAFADRVIYIEDAAPIVTGGVAPEGKPSSEGSRL